jgi:ribosomal protein L13E
MSSSFCLQLGEVKPILRCPQAEKKKKISRAGRGFQIQELISYGKP